MEKGTQETATEVKTLAITDENISQADYERLRSGETIEVEESAPEEKSPSKTVDESDTSKLEAKEDGSDEESDSDVDDEASEAKPKKKSGTQRRIEKLVKQRAEVERERDYLREQLLKSQKPPEAEKSKVVIEGKPKSDDYESYDDYTEALADWKLEQKLNAKDEAAKKEALKTKVVERVKTHNERVDAYRKDNPEFDKHLSNFFEEQGTDLELSMALEELITESENGPAILHELLKTPDELERINSLGAMGVARAIGRLEAKLSSASETKKTETKTKTTTKAPPPARPISASSANGKKSIYDEDISQSDYERMRAEQEKRRRA